MGLDVAVVTMDYLERPGGEVYEFALSLVRESAAWGEGNAMGFFMRSQLIRLANRYSNQHNVDVNGRNHILEWIESLSYDNGGYIILSFDW